MSLWALLHMHFVMCWSLLNSNPFPKLRLFIDTTSRELKESDHNLWWLTLFSYAANSMLNILVSLCLHVQTYRVGMFLYTYKYTYIYMYIASSKMVENDATWEGTSKYGVWKKKNLLQLILSISRIGLCPTYNWKHCYKSHNPIFVSKGCSDDLAMTTLIWLSVWPPFNHAFVLGGHYV